MSHSAPPSRRIPQFLLSFVLSSPRELWGEKPSHPTLVFFLCTPLTSFPILTLLALGGPPLISSILYPPLLSLSLSPFQRNFGMETVCRFCKIAFSEPWHVLLQLLQFLILPWLILSILHFRATLPTLCPLFLLFSSHLAIDLASSSSVLEICTPPLHAVGLVSLCKSPALPSSLLII